MVSVFQGIPKITQPLADVRTGIVAQPWFQLFVTLWNRTGGGTGVLPALGVGTAVLAWYIPAGPIAANATTASTNIAVVAFNNATSKYVATGDVLSGTWQALQTTPGSSNGIGLFVRTA